MGRIGEVRLAVNVDMESLIEDLVMELRGEKLVEFIIRLDAAAQEWDVTEPLCRHFAKLHEDWKRESAEDASRG